MEQQATPAPSSANQHDVSTYERYVPLVSISAKTLAEQTNIEDWVDEIELSDDTPKKKLNSYAANSIMELRTSSATDVRTLENFQDDFAEWKLVHFKDLGRPFLRELIATLRNKGISFEKDKTEATTLYRLAKGEHAFTVLSQQRTELPSPALVPTPQIMPPYEPSADQILPPQPVQPSRDSLRHESTTEQLHTPIAATSHETPRSLYLPHPSQPPYNPYQLPPTRDVKTENLASEKIVQF
jgi:hypothetical protein